MHFFSGFFLFAMRDSSCVEYVASIRDIQSPAQHPRTTDILARLVLPLLVALALCLFAAPLRAQEEAAFPGGLLQTDDGVVTGFPGVVEHAGKAFIDTAGPAVRIFELRKSGPLNGELTQPPVKLEIPVNQTGLVFGIAIDRMFPANIYVTATSAYGLHIVAPDEDGDGIAETLLRGRAEAQWMEGQWGPGAGPGGIWKIDGATGTVSLLADLPVGPAGLGQIAFDPVHYQLFVSDLDTGLIHRLDLNGNVIDTFDHGVTGRPAAGLEAVEDDGFSADITSEEFDIENPNTWGFTDVRRRVWGLAVHDGRLYYAVAAGPQVFSVSIDPMTGALGADVRLEIDQVPGGMQVSDILFDGRGRMYLAQRGTPLNALDFSTLHVSGGNKVLRYHRDPQTGQWVQTPPAGPRQYAIGFPRPHENATGGISLSCRGLLWSSGENLRNDPLMLPVGPYAVHGLQGNPRRAVLPRNAPPYVATFVDYDGRVGDMRNVGHVGDIEVYRDCVSWPAPPAGWTPPAGWAPPSPEPLPVPYKRGLTCVKDDETGDWLCDYEIRVINWGGKALAGPLVIWDIPAGGVSFEALLEASVGISCTQPGGPGTKIRCEVTGGLSLDLFAALSLKLRTRVPAAVALADAGAFRNCVAIGEDGIPRECSEAFPDEPRPVPEKHRAWCEKTAGGDYECRYVLTFTNNGGAPFVGKPVITDEPGPGVELVGDADGFGPDGFTPLPWTCAQPGGAGKPIVCEADDEVTIQPGESVDVEVITKIPAGSPPEAFRNCALVTDGGVKDCVEEKPDTSKKKELKQCVRDGGGQTCTFTLTFTNLGPGAWTGKPKLVDEPGPEVELKGNSAGWTCTQAGAGATIECEADADTTLNVGESASVEVTVHIPDGAPDAAYQNCLLLDAEGGLKQCVDIPKEEDPNLKPKKEAKGCQKVAGGMRCTYELTMVNTGPGTFSGAVALGDLVGPGVAFVSNADPGNWTCNQPGGAGTPIECTSNAAHTIPPGGSVSEIITVFIPDGSPDASYKDCLVPAFHMPFASGESCVRVPPPPPPEKPKLRTDKTFKQCRREGEVIRCTWKVYIVNAGSASFSGKLVMIDGHFPPVPGTTYSVTPLTPPPNWTCAQNAQAVQCQSDPTTLGPGEQEELLVESTFPADAVANQQSVQNCVISGVKPGSGGAKGTNMRSLLPMPFTLENKNVCSNVPPNAGVGCACVTGKLPARPKPRPRPRCPAGWEDFTGTQPPAGWQTMTVGKGELRRLCARPRPFTGVPMPPPGFVPPVVNPTPRPRCRAGELEIPYAQVRRYQRQGYRVRRARAGGRTIWCARPRTPQCRVGYEPLTPAEARGLAARGWRIYRASPRLYCGQPPVRPECPKGYQPVAPGRVGALRQEGWSLRRVGRNQWCGKPVDGPQCTGGRIFRDNVCVCPEGKRWNGQACVKPDVKPPRCPAGWQVIPSRKLPSYKLRKWRLRKAGNLWCGLPPIRICPPGKVRKGDKCVPRVVRPAVCKPGYRLVRGKCVKAERPCPKGFARKGGRCVPRVVRPAVCKPGYRLVRGKCVKAERPCPKGFARKGGRCVPRGVRPAVCKPGYRLVRGKCVKAERPCPKGFTRKGGRCVPRGVRPVRCKPGYRVVRGKCVPGSAASQPKPNVKNPPRRTCPKGTVRTNRGCVPVRIDPRVLRQVPNGKLPEIQ